MSHDPLSRGSLVPKPDRQWTSAFDEHQDIVGRWGAGLTLLHSSTCRLPLGYDWARGEDGLWRPHLRSRSLVTGHKALPWMHLGYVPHWIVPRDEDRTELVAFLGTFGQRFAFGDGVEANFPGYGILRTEPRKSAVDLWEDGLALELTAVTQDGEESFTGTVFRFRRSPGRLELWPESESSAFQSIRLCVPERPILSASLEIVLRPGLEGSLRIETRPLLHRLTVPPLDYHEPIDTLRAPYGFGNFDRGLLRPSRTDSGLRFDCPELALASEWIVQAPREVLHRLAPVDPVSAERAEAQPGALPDPAIAFDVLSEVPLTGDSDSTVMLGWRGEVQGSAGEATPTFTVSWGRAKKDAEGDRPFRIHSDDGEVDGYVRWASDVLVSLTLPNGVLATGALGYLGKSHVGQDIPLAYPALLYHSHERLQDAARRNLDYLWESPRRGDNRGIIDHPADGFDFAFIPYDPRHARFWKSAGAVGLLRQFDCLARYRDWTGDDERVERHLAVAREVYFTHYHPFDPSSELWLAGEETQNASYLVATAHLALKRFADLLERFGHEDRAAAAREDGERIRALANRPRGDGGFFEDEPIVAPDGRTIPGGLLIPRGTDDPGSWMFSYDILLVNAVALINHALDAEHTARVLEVMLDANNPWRVEGAGFAKTVGGGRGVWHWHNALIAWALCEHGGDEARELAWTLLRWMGRGVVDFNGIGTPGEETMGGDYSMAVGCLGILSVVEGFLRPKPGEAELTFEPRLPPSIEAIRVESLCYRDRTIIGTATTGGFFADRS
ncbi:MAG: hypothetical protein RL885_00650 [Planctomycetota bacterium]